MLFELRRTAAELGEELLRSGERLNSSGAESIDALADLAAALPVQASAPAEAPFEALVSAPVPAPAAAPVAEIPEVAAAPAPYFPSYEPSLPGVGTALAGLEPPYPVLNQHLPTPPEPPATSWPSWS